MGDRADSGTVRTTGASSLLNPECRVLHLTIEAVNAFALPRSKVR
jgi:hypothetical protein